MDIIAILNQKGGVAKTTTTLALGAALQNRGKRVLFVDLDPQRDLSKVVLADLNKTSAYEVLTRKTKALPAIQETAQGHIIPSSLSLAADGILTATGKEYRLKEALEPLEGMYDYILLDCPPSLGVLSVNALTAATGCIIPAQADVLSLEALDTFYQTYEVIKRYTNPALKLMGVVITRYSGRSVLSRDMADMIADKAEALGTKVYKTKIRECTALKEAQAVRESIYQYAPKSNAVKDYNSLIAEVIGEK